jgi:hypothetical protein
MSTVWLDWFCFTRKTALMQRLADHVRTGHRHFVAGQIKLDKVGYFAGKLDSLYDVGQDRLAASRQRKAGRASFRLLMLYQEGHETLLWWLLHTDGRVPDDAQREKWRDALVDPIELTGYELVRLTRPGAKLPAWTWRYQRQRAQNLRDAILRAVRTKRDDELRQLVDTIWRTPGFAGSRDQVKKMGALIVAEWKRSRGGDPMPELPARLGYVRRLPDVGMKLSELGERKRAHRRVVRS